jgi:hypothetical protein
MLCVKNVALMMTEMTKLPFPSYGSLYFADAPIDPNLKSEFVEGFCIGPHCGTQYWDCNPSDPRFYGRKPPNRGPCKWPFLSSFLKLDWESADSVPIGNDLRSYCSGLIDAGFSRIPNEDGLQAEVPYLGSVQEHHRLLEISDRVVQELAQTSIIEKVATPTLLHPDVHKRNIFVSEEDPSNVTAIIDWQSTSIEPAFAYATNTPDLIENLTADSSILEKLESKGDAPDTESSKETSMEDPEEKEARRRYEIDVETCQKTFDVVLQAFTQKLRDVRVMDQTLLRPFRYCNSSWIDSAAALRQELIDVSQRWTELGLPGHCPYQPAPEELAEHVQQYEDFETVQQLKLVLKHQLGVDSDGWSHADRWDEVTEANRLLFGLWLESANESGESEDRAEALWPFGEPRTLPKEDSSVPGDSEEL